MWKKLFLLAVLLLSCIWGGYGLVFWWNLVFNPDISFVGTTGSKIYLDDENLSTTIVVYQANVDISRYEVSSSCEVKSTFLESYKSLYFFSLDYSWAAKCRNGNIILSSGEEKIISSMTRLELSYFMKELGTFLDYSDEDLIRFQNSLEDEKKRYSIYKNYNHSEIAKNYKFLKGQTKYREASYVDDIIEQILLARQEKYIVPVLGGSISETHSKVPNSGRPYRQEYTDGIHHGWDVDGDYGEKAIALDDGIIVRVVDNFDESDFSRIVYGENLSDEQKLKNLDILRGKQVWLKTMKGEVVFYSHLDTISSDISEGSLVTKGDNIGTTWVTGVPQDGYDDFHLHFAIMKNPYIFENAGTYDLGDYMAWDWLTKWMSHSEVIEAQKNIFE